MRTTVLVILIICGWLYVNRLDYEAQTARYPVAKSAPPICPDKDYLGRRLVASYQARSDVIQIKRCTYTRRISS